MDKPNSPQETDDAKYDAIRKAVRVSSGSGSATGIISPLKEEEKQVSLESQEEIERLRVERQGKEKYYELRSRWSLYSFILLSVMILFQMFILFAVGIGWLDYTKYDILIKMVMGEHFLQIVGIALIVVKFLFPGVKDETPKKERKSPTAGKRSHSNVSVKNRSNARRDGRRAINPQDRDKLNN